MRLGIEVIVLASVAVHLQRPQRLLPRSLSSDTVHVVHVTGGIIKELLPPQPVRHDRGGDRGAQRVSHSRGGDAVNSLSMMI